MIRSDFCPRFTFPAVYSSLDVFLSTSKLQKADYEPHGLFSSIFQMLFIRFLALFGLCCIRLIILYGRNEQYAHIR
eukprot:snap_masked-scaffold_8-processed-gene-4.13-mRNA-1 protein AED:1.00 eAED:1.00 QI:0/0/0/0/1/1/2/0/75